MRSVLHRICLKLSSVLAAHLAPEDRSYFLNAMVESLIDYAPAQDRQGLRNSLYGRYLHRYGVIPIEERTRTIGWFDMLRSLSNVQGSIVEAGVGYGHSLTTLTLAVSLLEQSRKVFGFDSFSGFPQAHALDKSWRVSAGIRPSGWDDISPRLLLENLDLLGTKPTGWNESTIHFVKGYFSETMPEHLPARIALLHLDCDLYEGTLNVLLHTYPRLSPGAFVVLDEYHDLKWPGVRVAVDKFLSDKPEEIVEIPMLKRYGFKRLGPE